MLAGAAAYLPAAPVVATKFLDFNLFNFKFNLCVPGVRKLSDATRHARSDHAPHITA